MNYYSMYHDKLQNDGSRGGIPRVLNQPINEVTVSTVFFKNCSGVYYLI